MIRLINKLKLLYLLWKIKKFEMTYEQKEKQRRSFVYGTTKMSNDNITKEMINEKKNKLMKHLLQF